MFDVRRLTGWKQDTVGIQQTAREVGSLRQVASNLIGGTQEKEVHLWQALLSVKPTWRRGAQGIGDCTLGSSMVTMADGSLKRIDQVQVGDLVLSAKNLPRMVTRLVHKPPAPREMVRVTTRSGIKPYTATVDHRVPIVSPDNTSVWRPVGTVRLKESLVLAKGVDESRTVADTIDLAKFAVDPTTEDEIWGQPQAGLGRNGRRRKPVKPGQVREKGSKPVNRWISMDERLAWLLGLYAAEGSTDMSVAANLPTRITLNIGSHRRQNAETAAKYLHEIFGVDAEVTQVPSKPTVLYVRVSNRLVATFFYSMVTGNVYTKRLHSSLHVLPEKQRQAFVRGWFDGDGSVASCNQGVAATSSPALAVDIQRLLVSVGLEFSCNVAPADDERREAYLIRLLARTTQKLYPDWQIPVTGKRDGGVVVQERKELKKTASVASAIGLPTEVLNVERFIYEGPVYCLEVEHDHTFIVDGYAQHNCFVDTTLVTMANGRKKRIHEVRVGDYVASPLGGPSRQVIDVIAKPYNGPVVGVGAGDGKVLCTPDHEFHVPVNRYESSMIAARDLRPGMRLKTCSRVRSDGTTESQFPVIQDAFESFHHRGKVYCLTVEGDHCFYAGGFAASNCVSWGCELACTILMALDSIAGLGEWIAEAATEAIYGLARVEALGKTRGGRSDGAFGYAAAKALRDFGVALRINYANETGIAEHDLTKYDARKAKEWGDYGCGGSRDQGKLDAIIKQHPVGHIAQVKTIDEANGALDNYYPFTIASMAGFGDMKRNAEGLCAWVNSWAHQMMVAARRYVRGKAQYRVFQSWGDCCSGPDPGIDELLPKTASSGLYLPSSATTRADFIRRLILPDPAFPYAVESAADWNPISATSWWIDEATLAKILRTGDCWALAGIEGFRPRKLNVRKAVLDALKRG